jgi:hypothetical protein
MDKREKLATNGTQSQVNRNKNTKQYMFDTTLRKKETL